MKESFKDLNNLEITTIFKFCSKLLFEFKKEIKFVEKEQSIQILEKIFENDNNLKNYLNNELENKKIKSKLSLFKELLKWLTKQKNLNQSFDDFTGTSKIIFQKFEKYFEENKLTDYNSITTDCIKLLKSENQILKKLQEKYKYILIDELN
jgi:superfamily I DNA/RNA helicase